MDNPPPVMWPVEDIPDEDLLFYRVHKTYLQLAVNPQEIPPSCFRPHKDGMSTNWSRYATAIQTRDQATNPKDNAVVELPVGKVSHIPPLEVHHTPLPENRAHTNVLGLELTKNHLERNEIRTRLARLAKWVFQIGI